MSQLRNLGDHGAPQLENELAAKEKDIDAALLQLLEKEPIIVRLPAQVKYVEIGGKPEFPAKVGQIPVRKMAALWRFAETPHIGPSAIPYRHLERV